MIEPMTIRACVMCCTNGRDLAEDFAQSRPITPSQAQASRNHPFLEAVGSGNIEEIKIQMLLDPTIARTVQDKKGNSAAHVAAFYGLTSVFDHLITAEPELLWTTNEVRNTPAHKAAEAGHVPILAIIRDKEPALLSTKGAMGATPLHFAAAKASAPIPPSCLSSTPQHASRPLARGSPWAAHHGRP